MTDDKVVSIPGLQDAYFVDKNVELERLNTLLDTAMGALQEATDADMSHEEFMARLGRVKRLIGELEALLEALGVDPDVDPVMVRVRNKNGEDEQHAVTFPIYAKGYEKGVYRKIDSDLFETMVRFEEISAVEQSFGVVRRRIDFLDGRGAEYWLGRGKFELGEDEFEAEVTRSIMEVFQMAGMEYSDEE